MSDKISILIARYLSGEAAGRERLMLEDWISQSQENRQLFEETRAVWEKSHARQGPSEIPAFEDFWNAVDGRIVSGTEPVKEARPGIFEKAARRVSDYFTQGRAGYAWAAASVLVIASFLGIYSLMYSPEEARLQTHATKFGERSQLTLPDGSGVQLNAGSSITFHENFREDERRVAFSGQAFFSIKKDGRPFIIETPNAEIKVLGTRFDVKARDGKTEVVVKEGSVAFKSLKGLKDSVVILKSNENSICEGNLPPVKAGRVNADYLIAWLNHKFVFRKTPLIEIAGELQRTFDKKIILSESDLGRLTITGEFRDQDLEQILSSICLTLNLKQIRVRDGYLVSR